MIVITIAENQIAVRGHAGYAPSGQDICCAGISVLISTLSHALDELTPCRADCRLTDGDAEITIAHPSEDTALLVDAFCIGLADMAETYPGYIRIIERR